MNLDAINLSLIFVVNILTISVVGVLITHLIDDLKNKRYLAYISLAYLTFLIRNIFYVYNSYASAPDAISDSLIPVLTLSTVALILIINYALWGKVRKKAAILLISTSIIFVASCAAKTHLNNPIWTPVHLAAVAAFTIFLNFYVIEFLMAMKSKNAEIIKPVVLRLNKKTKKTLVAAISAVLIMAGLLLSFSYIKNSKKLSSDLVVYTWEDYFNYETIAMFEAEYGVDVKIVTFEDETVLQKELEYNPEPYDLAVVSDGIIHDLIERDKIKPIRKKNVPNIEQVSNECKDASYNTPKLYGAGYMQGTTGIAYNKKYVVENVNSWEIFWNKNYRGKIAMLNNKQEVVSAANKFVNGSIVPKTIHDFTHTKQFLKKEIENIKKFMEPIDMVDALVSEQIWVAQMYSGDALTAADKNEDIEYVLPKEGGTHWVDNFVIVSTSKKQYTAEVFINYMLKPEISALNTNYLWYANCTPSSQKYIDEEVFDTISLYKNQDNLDEFESLSEYNNLDKDLNSLIDELWNELENY